MKVIFVVITALVLGSLSGIAVSKLSPTNSLVVKNVRVVTSESLPYSIGSTDPIMHNEQGSYLNNKRHGYWKFFYNDGKVRSERLYHSGIMVDKWKYYFNNGNVQYDAEYDSNGNKSGIWSEYYANGRLKQRGRFDKNSRTGEWLQYYGSGKLQSTCNFQNDRLHGEIIVYHLNGAIQSKGFYVNNQKDGYWTDYHISGNVEKQEIFANGKLSGSWNFSPRSNENLRDFSKIVSTTTYENDRLSEETKVAKTSFISAIPIKRLWRLR